MAACWSSMAECRHPALDLKSWMMLERDGELCREVAEACTRVQGLEVLSYRTVALSLQGHDVSCTLSNAEPHSRGPHHSKSRIQGNLGASHLRPSTTTQLNRRARNPPFYTQLPPPTPPLIPAVYVQGDLYSRRCPDAHSRIRGLSSALPAKHQLNFESRDSPGWMSYRPPPAMCPRW